MITIKGKNYSGKGQSVNIDDGVLDTLGCEQVQSVEAELDRYGLESITPVQGWGKYTHLIRLEYAAWGILVTEK